MRLRPCVLVLSAWILPAAARASPGTIEGRVLDPAGGPIAGARVTLATPQQSLLATAVSDAEGRFLFSAVAPGNHLLAAAFPGLEAASRAVHLPPGGKVSIELRLALERLRGEVTVTASPGRAASVDDTALPVNVVPEERIAERARSVLAQALEGEAGVEVQRTSPTIAGVFIRGLTGRNVNVFLDGVPYSTSAQRGGISTFLDLVEPDTLRGIEVLRGPQGAEYGSASLGGSLQLLSRPPAFAAAGTEWRGSLASAFASADNGLAGSERLEWAGRRAALGVDLADRRVGAFRSRGDIADFFRHGATSRGLVGPGADGVPGSDDDLLLATGETLGEIQDRVLGPGVEGAALRATLPGHAVLDLFGSVRLGRSRSLLVELQNLTDASYRGMSWGMPGPGRGVRVRFATAF